MLSKKFFLVPRKTSHLYYEVNRAFYVEKLSYGEISKRFNIGSGYARVIISKSGSGFNFFRDTVKGPRVKHKGLVHKEDMIILRKRNYTFEEILTELKMKYGEEVDYSSKTIERILKSLGFGRLSRRTRVMKKKVFTKRNTYIPAVSENVELSELDGKSFKTSYGGIFLFVPIIKSLGLLELIKDKEIHLYKSDMINKESYFLSLLTLKLISCPRLSNVNNYNFDGVLGLFCRLNVLPKSTSMSAYSYKIPPTTTRRLLEKFISNLYQITEPNNKAISLDFYSVPHYGEKLNLEKNWSGSKNKAIRGALSVIANQTDDKFICYAKTNIKRKEASNVIIDFVKFMEKIKKKVSEYLLFDSKFTKYEKLDYLCSNNIKFITVKARYQKDLREIQLLNKKDWAAVKLSEKRKHKKVFAYEKEVLLKDMTNKLRQIYVIGTGHLKPSIYLTDDREMSISNVIETYGRRENIEQEISDDLTFFNLNKLSSDILVKVDVDLLFTVIANACYKLLRQRLTHFEKAKPKQIFEKFIQNNSIIKIKKNVIELKLALKAINPVLMDAGFKQDSQIQVPWLEGYKLKFKYW